MSRICHSASCWRPCGETCAMSWGRIDLRRHRVESETGSQSWGGAREQAGPRWSKLTGWRNLPAIFLCPACAPSQRLSPTLHLPSSTSLACSL
jgi:hypothetical protein